MIEPTELLPCPFCGHCGPLDYQDGSTYRWGVASCASCGASAGETRREYPDTGDWHKDAIAQWNSRAPVAAPLAPTDIDIDALWVGQQLTVPQLVQRRVIARAVLAKWGAQPVPAWYALVPVEPTPEMVDAAQEAYMPFGDMQLAIQLAIAAAPQPVAREPLSDEQYNILVEDLSEWSRHVEVDTAPQSLEKHIHQVFASHGIKGGQHGAE